MSLEDFARYVDKIAPDSSGTGNSYIDVGQSTRPGPASRGDDGPTETAATSQKRGRVLAGLAAVVVLVALIVGIAGLSGRDDDSAPVLAGPGESRTWIGPALLAPSGIDWSVSYWAPNGADNTNTKNATYLVQFDYHGFTWSLIAVASGAETGPEGVGSVTRVGSRDVTIAEAPNTLVGIDSAVEFRWTEQDGTRMSLSGATTFRSPEVGTNQSPPTDVSLDVVSMIEAVPLPEWTAALAPPDDVPDPELGVATRPLRLGLPSALANSRLVLDPWTQALSTIYQVGSDAHFELSSRTEMTTVAATDTPVTVRGVEGVRLQSSGGDLPARILNPLASQEPGSALSWAEDGTQMALWYPSTVSDDDAMALANSLVILDEVQWEALLYPAEFWSGSGGSESAGDEPTRTTTGKAGDVGADGWTVPPDDADAVVAGVLTDDPAAAQALGERLVRDVGFGECTLADQIDLGSLAGKADWDDVCGMGPDEPGQRGVRIETSAGVPNLYFGPADRPPMLTICFRHVVGDWWSYYSGNGLAEPCSASFEYWGV